MEGTRPWGPSRKRVPKCIKRPKTTYAAIAMAEKQSKRSKKGPFSLYSGSPGSHPGDGINGARRGRSLPVHPGFSSHAPAPQGRPIHHRNPGQKLRSRLKIYPIHEWTDLSNMGRTNSKQNQSPAKTAAADRATPQNHRVHRMTALKK